MQNGIVLSDVFGMCRRRGHFPLSLGRPGNWRTRKLEHIAGCGVCPVRDDGPPKVGVCIPDQLPTAVGYTMRLRGFDVAKQSLQSDLVVRLRLSREATQLPSADAISGRVPTIRYISDPMAVAKRAFASSSGGSSSGR
jgi:hypothetical protein